MQDPTTERLTPDEAFALVGHETRIAILRAVMDAADEAGDPSTSVPFSELRARVGMRDSGQFNYHLGKLAGPFLDHDENGYSLRYTSLLVMGSVLAGTYTERGVADPVAASEPCPVCEGTVEATYEDERGTVACADCGETFSSSAIPPGALEDYDPSEYPEVFERWTGHLMDDLQSGFCLACAGRVDARVVPGDDGVTVHYECRRCPEMATTSLGAALLSHPAVVGFHWDHGLDLRDVRSWTLGWLHDDHAAVISEDPLRVECTVPLDDERLVLTVDGGAAVLDVERC
jgi:hypothetical protein